MIEIGGFFLLAVIILLGASIVIFAKNPVHNAMGLVLTLLSLAVLYLTMSATFIAMVQVLVYAGAVMTLFLFVIMMIGVDKEEERKESIQGQSLLVLGLVFMLMGLLTYVSIISDFKWDLLFPQAGFVIEGTPDSIASILFTIWVLPFEAVSILLIVATAAAIGLAYDRSKKDI
jgi:NADH-quinone oxidoreductase subunit J